MECRARIYSGVQKLRNSEKNLGNLCKEKKVEHVQGCKLQYNFLNILSVFSQNLRSFDPLTEK